jgi:lactonase
MDRKNMENIMNGEVPLSPELKLIYSVAAEPWLQIDTNEELLLEGPAFDHEGNLVITSPSAGLVFKIDKNRHVEAIFSNKKIIVDGSAFHKDGRLFIVCLSGELLIMNSDGSNLKVLRPQFKGKTLSMNDVVFDPHGNMYVTDFIGSIMEPTGGVYRLSEDASVVNRVVSGLVTPNGVSLSPENDVLWIGESFRNAVTRIMLSPDGVTPHPIGGVMIVYNSPGIHGPDSNKVDSAGNLYQCITGQGRIIVLNKYGVPIANVLVPGREAGKYLRTTNLAFKPGTDEGYITTAGKGGAWIFKFKALAKGLTLFSHQ